MITSIEQSTAWIEVCISRKWIDSADHGGIAEAYKCMDQLNEWCKQNVGPKNTDWSWTFPNYIFRSEADAVAFRLTFGV